MAPVRFIVLVCLVLAACGGDGESVDEASPTAVVTTVVTTTTLAATTTQATTTTTEPTTTTTTQATTTTSTVSDEQLAAAAAVGDIAAGEELYNTELDLGLQQPGACTTCHTLDGVDSPWAPTHGGISKIAGERVEGMSAVDYLRESIVDPRAFQVDNWILTMPQNYSEVLSEEQINNLIAFLLTR
jgi:mono/diheme cytochrome c family protein